jgi:hypothetical protein
MSLAALRVRFPVCSGGAKFRHLVVSLYDTHEADTAGRNSCVAVHCMVSFMLRQLYFRRNSPGYLLNRRLGGPQSWSGNLCRRENIMNLLGVEQRILQPIARCCGTAHTADCSLALPDMGSRVYKF